MEPTFTERLLARRALWWGRPFRWQSAHAWRDALHRTRERWASRCASDPDAAWRCCAHWQRTLVDKAVSRAFAQKHDCRIPPLYWQGRRIGAIPFASLPARYAIRPVRGTAASGVYVIVDGRDVLRDVPLTAAELRGRLLREHGPLSLTPLLVEAYVPADGGPSPMPVEYKVHTFGNVVGAVQVLERTGQRTGIHRYYTPHWEAFPDAMDTHYALAPPRPPPRDLDLMLADSTRLGRAIGTYMRVDFFGSPAGAVFNEFSSTPQVQAPAYTPGCDALFGALWQRHFPDAA